MFIFNCPFKMAVDINYFEYEYNLWDTMWDNVPFLIVKTVTVID